MRMPCVLVYKLGKTCDDPDFFPGRGAKRTVFGPRKTGHDILSSSSSDRRRQSASWRYIEHQGM